MYLLYFFSIVIDCTSVNVQKHLAQLHIIDMEQNPHSRGNFCCIVLYGYFMY